jgi:hypothetical protein
MAYLYSFYHTCFFISNLPEKFLPPGNSQVQAADPSSAINLIEVAQRAKI